MKKPIRITDLLMGSSPAFAEALNHGRVKVVRHTFGADRQGIKAWIGDDPHRFDLWQGRQIAAKNVFHDCKFVVSFLGLPDNRARFVGVCENMSGNKPRNFNDAMRKGDDKELLTELDEATPDELKGKAQCFYKLERLGVFSCFEGRAIIKLSPRPMVRPLTLAKSPEVLEVLSKKNADRAAHPFPGMGEVRVSFDEMAQMVNSREVYGEWHSALKSSKGVYLIMEQDTRKMYVGAAYNNDGILGRWKEYAESKHGGNKGLIARLQKEPNAYHQFQFSILQQLPLSANEDEVRNCENMWKDKLRTREFGYNHN